jgi:hypothetical protein
MWRAPSLLVFKSPLLFACIATISILSHEAHDGQEALSVSAPNAIGYVNTDLSPGLNLISNPLIPLDARLKQILTAEFPNGTEVHFLTSTGYVTARHDSPSRHWTPSEAAELSLSPGDGFFIHNPTGAAVAITFVGTVPVGWLTNHIPAGLSIQSSIVPHTGGLDVLGFPAEPGDMVFLYDVTRQRYEGFFFDEFQQEWRPSIPEINVGEAFFVLKTRAIDWVRHFSIIPGSSTDFRATQVAFPVGPE